MSPRGKAAFWSFLSGLLFLASAIGGLWFEYSATLGYDASQPYNWIIESISDLGIRYRQVHPLKHYNVVSYRAQTLNFGLMWIGTTFALAHLHLFLRTRGQHANNVATIRSVRTFLSFMFAAGAFLMATIHGGPREKHWKTIVWHWNGFTLLALAGNLNSILAGIRPHQVGGLDGNSLYRVISVLLGLAGFASFVKFNFLLGEWNYKTQLGLWQRGSLYPVAAWQIITGLGLITRSMSGSKNKQA